MSDTSVCNEISARALYWPEPNEPLDCQSSFN